MKRSLVPLGAAALVPAVMFLLLPPLGHAGLWDPHELRVADAARAPVDLATAPPLALWSIAAGYRLFGAHDWAGRLPLALWGVLGAVATYAWVARLVDRRAGLYAAIALATMPLYFVQARTMLGGIVGMSAMSASFGALAVACFHEGCTARERLGWILGAALALVAGLFGAGALVGAAVPLASVGAAWGIARLSSAKAPSRASDVVGAVSLVAGVALAVAAVATFARGGHLAGLLLGAVPASAAKPSFAHVLSRLAHSLAPWSAFAPLAFGRLFVPPPVADDAARGRETSLRVALLVGAGVALAAHTWLAAAGVDVPFVAPALVAAAVAIALFDFERGAPPSIAAGAVTAVLVGVLLVDFRAIPDETLAPFAVGSGAMPEGFRASAERGWAFALGVFALFALATWVEREPARRLFDRARLTATLRAVSASWGGNAWRVYAAVTVGAVVATAGLSAGARFHVRWATGVAAPVRSGVFLLAAGLVVAPPVLLVVVPLACDAVAWFAARVLAGRRGALLVAGGLASGLVLSAWQYPALAAQLSPKGALEAYARARKDGDALGLLGVSERAASSAASGAKPEVLADSERAYAWLGAAPPGQRRFLLAAPSALPALDMLYRARSPSPHVNAPVLDARSSDALLVASSLLPGEHDENPWNAFTLTSPPTPQHPTDVDLSGQVAILGWDINEEGGAKADTLVPGRKYEVRTYLRVEQRPTVAWQVFVHIDGYGRRQNEDHPLLAGKYGPTSWVAGDLLVDIWELSLPPNFSSGTYRLYYGFWQGDSRLPVTRGPSDTVNRVDFGDLHVR